MLEQTSTKWTMKTWKWTVYPSQPDIYSSSDQKVISYEGFRTDAIFYHSIRLQQPKIYRRTTKHPYPSSCRQPCSGMCPPGYRYPIRDRNPLQIQKRRLPTFMGKCWIPPDLRFRLYLHPGYLRRNLGFYLLAGVGDAQPTDFKKCTVNIGRRQPGAHRVYRDNITQKRDGPGIGSAFLYQVHGELPVVRGILHNRHPLPDERGDEPNTGNHLGPAGRSGSDHCFCLATYPDQKWPVAIGIRGSEGWFWSLQKKDCG